MDKSFKVILLVIGAIIGFFIFIITIAFDIAMGPIEDLVNRLLSDLIVNLLGIFGIHIIGLDGLFSSIENFTTTAIPLIIICATISVILWVITKIKKAF